MKYLKFAVKNMTVTRQTGDKTALITGAVGYFGLEFEFDEEFGEIEGTKSVELFKNKTKKRIELVDGKCVIPNEFLRDKTAIELRVVSGDIVATPWTSVNITESGTIEPEEPEEDAPEGTSYVKSPAGEHQVAQVKEGDNGLEYTKDGTTWKNANGVKKDATFVEKLKTNSDIAKKINEIIDILTLNGITTATGADRISVMGQEAEITQYGNKKISDLMDKNVAIEWDGLTGKVTGNFKNVADWQELPGGTKSGHFFAMTIDEKYKGKPFDFIMGDGDPSHVDSASDDEMFWVLRIDKTKEFTFKSGDDVIVKLDFSGATLDK